ncbi:MAG: flotillin [Calditrichaeota bacterium]|nr:flotillin [Calditrichota bacterium]
MISTLIVIGVIVVVIALFIVAIAFQYRKVGPNEVLIISGGRKRTVIEPDGTKRKVGYRMHIGGGTFVLPLLETAQTLPLEVFTIPIKTPEVLTAAGVHIIAEAIAQVKVGSSEHLIRTAAEQFLGRGAQGIQEVSAQILEGSVRAALGSMTVEDIYQKREVVANRVMQISADDFARMGLQVLSFALKDISDTQGYLQALGKPRIAQVKADAEVAQAEADKQSTIKSALARKEGDVVKFRAETELAEANRDYELKRAEYQAIINQKRALTDIAYDLERQKLVQELRRQELEVKLVEKEGSIQLEEKEIERKSKELEAQVKLPADAKSYQAKAEADAESYRLALLARGKNEARRSEGLTEAELTQARGEAEAAAMKEKAQSWKAYNDAAIVQMVMDKLPELARAVSEPLSKVDKIVMMSSGDGSLGTSKITGQVAEVLAQLPTIVETLTGMDLKSYLRKISEEKKSGPSGPSAEAK